jgi:transcription elongation GreA/GreB family factor
LEKIDFENEIYYAISVQVPIFKAMEGKKEGDEFSFNGVKHKILTII